MPKYIIKKIKDCKVTNKDTGKVLFTFDKGQCRAYAEPQNFKETIHTVKQSIEFCEIIYNFKFSPTQKLKLYVSGIINKLKEKKYNGKLSIKV